MPKSGAARARPSSQSGSFRGPAASGLVRLAGCLVLAVILFGSTLGHPFLSDDALIIGGNPTMARRSADVPLRLFGMDYWSQIDYRGEAYHGAVDQQLYRPVTMLSYWINARLTGVRPAGFRAVNILLHGAAAAAAGGLCAAWLGPAAGVAGAAAVLLHPAATDVINRVVGRADILVLLGLSLFLLIDLKGGRRGWNLGLGAVAALAAATALGAKESGWILLPLALVQAAADPERRANGRRGRWVGPVLALLVTLLFAALRLRAVGPNPYGVDHSTDLLNNPLQGVGMGGRLAPGLSLAFYYARMLVWPWPLLVVDRPAGLPGWSAPAVWLGLVLLIGAVAAAGWAARRPGVPRRAALLVGVAWWLLSFALVGQILTPIGTYREVRLVYPMLGALAFGTALAWSLRRRALQALCGLLFAAFAITGVGRNGDFRDETSMVQADVARNPRVALTHSALGMLYSSAGRTADARRELEESVRLAPTSSQAHADLGGFCTNLGDSTRAEVELRRALQLDSLNAAAYLNLGFLRLWQKRPAEAYAAMRHSERLEPQNITTQMYLGLLEASGGDYQSARRRIDRVAARSAGNPEVERMQRMIDEAQRKAGGQRE